MEGMPIARGRVTWPRSSMTQEQIGEDCRSRIRSRTGLPLPGMSKELESCPAWASNDVIAFRRDYASDITTIHVQDIDPQILAEGVASGWDYKALSEHDVFTKLGEGLINTPAVFAMLEDAGFRS